MGDASLVTAAADPSGGTATSDKPSYIIEQLKSLPEMYDASGLTMTQKFATSDDGTRIPYFLIAKEGTVLDGNTPTLLYGYGGFEISLGPKYIASVGVYLQRRILGEVENVVLYGIRQDSRKIEINVSKIS